MSFLKRRIAVEQTSWTFDLNTLPDDVREFYEQFLDYGWSATANVKEEYIRIASQGHVQTIYLHDREFNAEAISHGDHYHILLNVAIPCLLHFIYNNTLRLPHIFAHVGHVGSEQPYREFNDNRAIPFVLPSSAPIAESLTNLPGMSRPADDERALFATALTEVACIYCVFHEIGHVIGGHAGYQAQRLWGSGVCEFTSGRTYCCPRQLLRQVWEREADIIATVMIISLVLTDAGARQHFSECFQIAGSDDEGYSYQVLPVVLFALKLLFLYFAQVPLRLNFSSNHPHPLVRITYVHSALRLVSRDDLGLDLGRLDNLFDQATGLADQCWSDLGLCVPLLEGSKTGPQLAKAIERHVMNLEEAHKRLQCRYSRWSFIPGSAWKEHQS